MNHLAPTLHNFFADEAGYDMVEFAMGAALLGSIAVMALKDQSPALGSAIDTAVTWLHQTH